MRAIFWLFPYHKTGHASLVCSFRDHIERIDINSTLGNPRIRLQSQTNRTHHSTLYSTNHCRNMPDPSSGCSFSPGLPLSTSSTVPHLLYPTSSFLCLPRPDSASGLRLLSPAFFVSTRPLYPDFSSSLRRPYQVCSVSPRPPFPTSPSSVCPLRLDQVSIVSAAAQSQ